MFRSFTSTLMSALVSVCLMVGLFHYTPTNSFASIRQATWELRNEFGTCSAVAISPSVLLTAAHCDGPGMSVNGIQATLLKKDPSVDLMMVYVLGLNSPYLKVAKDQPGVDEKVLMSGFPLGVGEVVTEGRVQAITSEAPKHYMLVTSQGVFGNSGGPVVVRRGMHYEVVGIASVIMVATVGAGMFVIPNIVPHLMGVVNTKAINEFIK